jgi:hypothetical protein
VHYIAATAVTEWTPPSQLAAAHFHFHFHFHQLPGKAAGFRLDAAGCRALMADVSAALVSTTSHTAEVWSPALGIEFAADPCVNRSISSTIPSAFPSAQQTVPVIALRAVNRVPRHCGAVCDRVKGDWFCQIWLFVWCLNTLRGV